jgi:hypothetical protein
MQIPIPVLAAIGVAFLALILIVLVRRPRGRDLMGPPRASLRNGAHSRVPTRPHAARAPFPSGLPPALELEVQALLEQGRKLEAIKRVREETHVGLTEAKTMVERL